MCSNAYSSFDSRFENSTTIYLTQCLVFALTNNCQFQKQMNEYLTINKSSMYISISTTKIIIKATSDYGKKTFP